MALEARKIVRKEGPLIDRLGRQIDFPVRSYDNTRKPGSKYFRYVYASNNDVSPDIRRVHALLF